MYDLQVLNYEKSTIRTVVVKDEIWWVLADISKVLGIVNHKQIRERLDDDEVGMFGIPHPQNSKKILKVSCVNESGLYSVILRSDKPEAKKFKRWVTHEVLPTIRKTGTYTMKHEPKTDKPYEYFDKTYNGVPVLTSADMEYLTKINHSTIDWNLRTKFISGKDFYYIFGNELKKYKKENPKASKMSSALYLVTREGFIKICRAYGVQIDTPKCFEVKEEPRISAVRRIYDTFCKHYNIKRYQLTEDAAKILKCGENGITNESCILRKTDSDEYKIFTDPTMPLLERQFTLTENLGRIMAGQLRENANPDINYDQEARLFGIVVMAMSLFFDK